MYGHYKWEFDSYVYEESRTAALDQYGSPVRIHSDCSKRRVAQKEELLMIIHVSACLNNLEESEKPVITGNWTWGRWQCSDY